MAKTTVDTQTKMLPDWRIQMLQNIIEHTLKVVEIDRQNHPYECIGRMEATLQEAQRVLAVAKPTKQEFYYEVNSDDKKTPE